MMWGSPRLIWNNSTESKGPKSRIRRPPLWGPPGCEESCCNPVSSGPCILCIPVDHVSYVLFSQFQGSWNCCYRAREGTIYHQPGIWGDPKITLKIHQISSQSPGQQKSWKLVPRQSKIMKNGSWNHEKSDFCESWFLQYLPCQMLVLATPTTRFQTQKSSEKTTWK